MKEKRISRSIPPDVCHAHKANAKVTSINAAAARQLAILKYFYGDDGPTAIGCFGGEAATWAADHIGDGTKAWKNYKGKTLKCVHPSIFRTTAPRASASRGGRPAATRPRAAASGPN